MPPTISRISAHTVIDRTVERAAAIQTQLALQAQSNYAAHQDMIQRDALAVVRRAHAVALARAAQLALDAPVIAHAAVLAQTARIARIASVSSMHVTIWGHIIATILGVWVRMQNWIHERIS